MQTFSYTELFIYMCQKKLLLSPSLPWYTYKYIKQHALYLPYLNFRLPGCLYFINETNDFIREHNGETNFAFNKRILIEILMYHKRTKLSIDLYDDTTYQYT